MRLLRELDYVRQTLPTLLALRKVRPDSTDTVADVVEGVVDAHGSRIALLTDDEAMTYGELDRLANQVANHFAALGVRQGDVIALDMENRPLYVAIWYGLAKLGAVTALVNTNLTGAPLAHCLNVAEPAHIVLGNELAGRFESARDQLDRSCPIWTDGLAVPGGCDLLDALADVSDVRPDRAKREGLTAGSTDLFYIFTSGTTGLPKAAHFSHMRYLTTAIGAASALRFEPDDRQYVCLPLYHTAGGVMALGAALMSGASSALVPKFSAHRFWSDAVKFEATSFQYIGELMRYLVNTPRVPEEQQHRIEKCMGNGLRPEIWNEVSTRFGISRIVEFYGATEGNVALVNLDGTPGSVGRSPGWLRKLSGMHLVRFDVENEEVERGPDGFCIECRPGEVGEAIGRISQNQKVAIGHFEGYSDPSATEKKILRDVFEHGDAFFRTGDLLRYDDNDYFYFIDRIGDTFRWKGENVATTEVAEVMSVLPDVAEANVYGVAIPGTDGRAGMASIVPDGGPVDLARLYEATERDLPSYARPLFIRVRSKMEVTGTFKHRKVDLVNEGFDPSAISDDLYFRDSSAGAYTKLDDGLFQRINRGELRL